MIGSRNCVGTKGLNSTSSWESRREIGTVSSRSIVPECSETAMQGRQEGMLGRTVAWRNKGLDSVGE